MHANAGQIALNACKHSATLTRIAQFDAICCRQSTDETADMWTRSDNDRACTYWAPLLTLLSSVYWFALWASTSFFQLLEINVKHKKKKANKIRKHVCRMYTDSLSLSLSLSSTINSCPCCIRTVYSDIGMKMDVWSMDSWRTVIWLTVIGLWNLPVAEAHRQTSSLTLLESQDLAEETPKNPESFFTTLHRKPWHGHQMAKVIPRCRKGLDITHARWPEGIQSHKSVKICQLR